MTYELPFFFLNWSDPEDRVLQVLHRIQKNISVESAIHNACEKDYVSCLEYVHLHGNPEDVAYAWNDVKVCIMAARHGALRCLRYASDNGCPCDERVAAAAAKSGNEECLRLMLDRNCPVNASVCSSACENGKKDVACLKLAHERGVPWDADASGSAASHVNMPCLEYLLEHGCPFDLKTFAIAVETMFDDAPSRVDTYIQCLKYLIARGCPWSRRELMEYGTEELIAEFPTECPWDDVRPETPTYSECSDDDDELDRLDIRK